MSNSTNVTSQCDSQDRLCIILVYQVELIVIPVLLLATFLCTLVSLCFLRLLHKEEVIQHHSQRRHTHSNRRQHLQGIDAPSGLNPLDYEAVPMRVQTQQHKPSTNPAAPQVSTERQYDAFEQITPLPLSFTVKPDKAVSLFQATMDQKPVVLRVLNESADSRQRQVFLGFAHFLSEVGPHPCLPRVLGVVKERAPLIVILEGLENKDLLGFLWSCRKYLCTQTKQLHEDSMSPELNPNKHLQGIRSFQNIRNLNKLGIILDKDHAGLAAPCVFTEKVLLRMARQIASALEHLHSKNYTHGNLGARSVLVGRDLSVKLWGFGAAYRRRMQVGTSEEVKEVEMRKWHAPEVLAQRSVTHSSDIWSFGILLYEMVTLGEPPFPKVMPSELLQYLQRGKNLKKPNNCSSSLYSIIRACCQWRPQDRASLKDLISMLQFAERNASNRAILQVPEPLDIEKYMQEAGYGEAYNFAVF